MKPILRFTFVSLFVIFLCSCGTRQDNQRTDAVRIMNYSNSGAPQTFAMLALASPQQTSDFVPGENTLDRMVIKTACITIEVSKYDEAFISVQKIAADLDGFISSSMISSGDRRHPSGRVTVRVSSKKFDETFQRIKKIATNVENEEISGSDVTEEFYDVSARLENKQKAEKRYQEILKVAKKAKEVLEIEEAITGVREEIEQLMARKHYLSDQTKLSTINVSMHEPYPAFVSEKQGFWSKITTGTRAGFDGFTDTVSFLITTIITYSPILFLVIIFLIIVVKYVKLNKKLALMK